MIDEPVVKPYQPFPTFVEWSRGKPKLASFDSLAAAFSKSKHSYSPEALAKSVDVATKWAAIDTGAIEGLYEVERGFTFTMALNAASWENMHQVRPDHVVRAIEDAMEAYEYVLDIATGSRPITEVWIRELHATICASQSTYTVYTSVGPQERQLDKGAYKTDPNSPLNLAANEIHSYASPEDTIPEMARLVEELKSDLFANAHPILQASYAHYAFVCIHPFPDGNGRVARALSSIYLYRHVGLPLVVFADQKPSYLDALESADRADYSLFIRFISERTIDAMGMARTVLENASTPSISEQIKAANDLLVGRGGVSHQEFDAIGLRFLDAFAAAFDKVIHDQGFTAPFRVSTSFQGTQRGEAREGYRPIPDQPRILKLEVRSSAPLNSAATRSYNLLLARPGVSDVPDFLLVYKGGEIAADLRELHPTLGAALQFRLETTAEAHIGILLRSVVARGEDQLRNQGYAI